MEEVRVHIPCLEHSQADAQGCWFIGVVDVRQVSTDPPDSEQYGE